MFEELKWTALLADDLLFEKVMTLSTQQKITGKNLRNVLQRAFKLNNEKVKLRMTGVPYIGHLLTIEGIKPGSRKLKLSRICHNQRMSPQ